MKINFEYLEAWFMVMLYKACNAQEYEYAWWRSRMNLIKRGEI